MSNLSAFIHRRSAIVGLIAGAAVSLILAGILFKPGQGQILYGFVVVMALLFLLMLLVSWFFFRGGQKSLSEQTESLSEQTESLSEQTAEIREELEQLRAALQAHEESTRKKLLLIGVVDIAETLKNSEWEPTRVMGRATGEIDFMGCFGHKWVQSDQHMQEFRRMLARVQLNRGMVRFLLLHPHSADAVKIANVRYPDISEEYEGFPSIAKYESLSREFSCFELRLTREFIPMRVLAVDGRCAVSSYLVTGEPSAELEAPQVICTRDPGLPRCWSLYSPLVDLFHQRWNESAEE